MRQNISLYNKSISLAMECSIFKISTLRIVAFGAELEWASLTLAKLEAN